MRVLSSFVAAALVLLSFTTVADAQGRGARPAPPPSRYRYTLEFDLKSLPPGVKLREFHVGGVTRYLLKNTSQTPLIINERFQGERLVTGDQLVSGKVYQYFPNGVPMEGKMHLKGWQAPFGDIEEAGILLPKEPAKIYEGRRPGLSKELPKPEPVTIPAKYDGKPYEIKAVIRYHLNDAYDAQK